jgi:hypothetical protein
MFLYTFENYSYRQAQFVVSGSVVSSLTKTFANPYSTKVGTTGTPSNNPALTAGDVVYPTYNATDRSITKPTTAIYANYDWYTKDGTSCNVTQPTADCGPQDSTTLATFPDASHWTPAMSTEVAGNVTYYGREAMAITSITPNHGLETGGTVVTITGTKIIPTTTGTPTYSITFDGLSATNVSVVDNNDGTETITATTPAHSAGLVDVVISNGIDTVTMSDAYTYDALYISLTIDNSNINIGSGSGLTPTPSGTFGSSSNTATVKTNNPTGYVLSIATDTDDSNLKHTSLSDVISPTNGTWSTKTSLQTNTWGFTLTNNPQDSQTVWSAVPNKQTPLTIKTTNQANETGDSTNIFYGVKVDMTKPAGVYQAIVTYSVLAGS